MKNFKSFILEGGNIKVGGVSSSPIDIKDRESKSNDIRGMLHSINKASGHKFYGKGGKGIDDNSIYSGSTHHMMNSKISTKELSKYKKSFGDVDVQIPKEHKDELDKHLEPGKKYGKFTVVAKNKHGAETSAILKHEDGKHHQIDFEHTDFDKNHSPTAFSKLYHSSHMDDMKQGLKGVSHKILLSSVAHANGKENKKHTLSYHGIRDSSDKKATHDTDLHSIHKKLFGKDATDSDISDMHSFHGVTKLMKKHLNHEQIKNVVSHYSENPEKHDEQRKKSVAVLKKTFPEHFKG